MGSPLSIDLRQRIVAAYDRKTTSFREVATRFGVGEATVNRYVRLVRETGCCEPRPHGGGKPRLLSPRQVGVVHLIVLETPDKTIAEVTKEFCRRASIPASESTIGRVIRRLGLTRKKRLSRRRKQTARASLR